MHYESGRDCWSAGRRIAERPSCGEPALANPRDCDRKLKPYKSLAFRQVTKNTAESGVKNRTTGPPIVDVYFAPICRYSQKRKHQSLFDEACFEPTRRLQVVAKTDFRIRALHIAQMESFGPRAAFVLEASPVGRGHKTRTKIENPLLRSGLALAGEPAQVAMMTAY